MIRGLYIARNGMMIDTERLSLVSNNLANTETTGFKKDTYTYKGFNEILIDKFNGTNVVADKPLDKINVEKNGEDFKVSTDSGYFRVKTSRGISNHRAANFSVDPDGYLSTYFLNSNQTKDWHYGDKILGSDGKTVFVGRDTEVEVTDKGDVLVDGSKLTNLIKQSGKNTIGSMSIGMLTGKVVTNFEQGHIRQTGRNQDIAINGEGFFVIGKDDSEIYTRNGSFYIGQDRVLKTADGKEVQGLRGKIQLQSDDFRVNERGEVISNGKLVDKIKVVNFSNLGDLSKLGGGYFKAREKMNGEIVDFKGTVEQGCIEGSNTNVVNEMINMISLSRNYETSQKVVTTIDATIGKAVNEVGKL